MLVTRSRGGDVQAWGTLWMALDPWIEGVARRGAVMGRLSACPDARRDIVVRVMGDLRADVFRRLGELGELLERGDGSYRRWLCRVARNAAVSYVRAHAEYLGPSGEGAARWAEHVPLSEVQEEACAPESRGIDARRILEHARDVLAPAQAEALDRWLQGDDFAEIAAALSCAGGADGAARLVRSAVQRLRRGCFEEIDRCA